MSCCLRHCPEFKSVIMRRYLKFQQKRLCGASFVFLWVLIWFCYQSQNKGCLRWFFGFWKNFLIFFVFGLAFFKMYGIIWMSAREMPKLFQKMWDSTISEQWPRDTNLWRSINGCFFVFRQQVFCVLIRRNWSCFLLSILDNFLPLPGKRCTGGAVIGGVLPIPAWAFFLPWKEKDMQKYVCILWHKADYQSAICQQEDYRSSLIHQAPKRSPASLIIFCRKNFY